MARVAVSWSAGKDSMLALLRAREQGLAVATLLTMCEADGTSKSHALAPALIEAQAAALGLAWRPARVADEAGAYGRAFADALAALHGDGHDGIVFGDIDLQAHRDWLEPACARAGLRAHFPLWGEPRAALAREIVARGIRARLVCVDAARLDAGFCGADYDAQLLDRLPKPVCPCGEDGEFHSFVFDGPGFAAPLSLRSLGQERVASRPPLAATTLVFDRLVLA
ncbi:MAG TPA: adenosine nucleotide hydrolase [Methylibium sp.]|uniref:Dph6-related ATP pyrophosphatase n=1 Tax=Methylibium sp. TaxID=2067992 RepID=UPI002DBDCD8C|nr:adenosine nucleotide hydrolase [Methylibium sp.]HEU4459894.1 adenosine nucleotide hydrolase [Methylibium sp.]